MGLLFQTLKAVFIDTIADFLYTPLWWYTRGLWRQMRGTVGSLAKQQRDLAIAVWLKNLFVPMYGQYDITGRIISFFMRLAQIVGRAIVLVIWVALLLMWLVVWILIPVGVGYLIFTQISLP